MNGMVQRQHKNDPRMTTSGEAEEKNSQDCIEQMRDHLFPILKQICQDSDTKN